MMDRLTIWPNTIDYEGSPLQVMSIELNGQRITASAAPFTAAARVVQSQICAECYASSNGQLASCSPADIAVRREGDVIYWYLVDMDRNPNNLSSAQIWSFAREEYELQLPGDTSQLPSFADEEIVTLLRRSSCFAPNMGLYTIPDLADDPQGRQLLAAVGAVLNGAGMMLTAAPERYSTFRIGIETTGVPECVLKVSKSADQCAVCFADNPSFPLWLTSAEIERQMRRYCE